MCIGKLRKLILANYNKSANTYGRRNEKKRERRAMLRAIFRTDSRKESIISDISTDSEDDDGIKKRFVMKRKSNVENAQELDKEEKIERRKKFSSQITIFKRFLTGIIFSHVIYFLMSYTSKWNKQESFYSGIAGFFVATAMAFSQQICCVVLLMIPSFCTAQGRVILLTMSLFLVINGPMQNIGSNYHEMTRVLMCGNELAFNVTKGLRTSLSEGRSAVVETMDDTVDAIVEAVETAEEMYDEFLEKVEYIEDKVEIVRNFIYDIGKTCTTKFGAFFCIIPSYLAKKANLILGKQINNKVRSIKNEFYFTLNYTYDFNMTWETTKKSDGLARVIIKEVKERFHVFKMFFDSMKLLTTFSVIFVLIKAVRYRLSWLTVYHFDNLYITKRFKQIDLKKELREQKFILPLNRRELKKYVFPWDPWMTKMEVQKLGKGSTFITFNLIYTLAILGLDVLVYRFLDTITAVLTWRRSKLGLLKEAIKSAIFKALGEDKAKYLRFSTGMNVSGRGFAALIYRSIASAMEELTMQQGYKFSLEKCLPNPKPPDKGLYSKIALIFLWCYLVCIFEAYILRLRHYIMGKFYPKREKSRIGFLHAKMLKNRKLNVRSELIWLLNKAKGRSEENSDTFLERWSRRGGILGWVARRLAGKNYYRCVICSISGGKNDADEFEACKTAGCQAWYCVTCYKDVQGVCFKCLQDTGARLKRQKKLRSSSSNKTGGEYEALATEFIAISGISDSSEQSDEENSKKFKRRTKRLPNKSQNQESEPLIGSN